MLALAKARDRLSHAYLIIGDNVDLLEDFAFNLAGHCACISPQETGEACRQCQVCRGIAERKYSELHTLYPVSKSRQIVVDDIRDFEHRLHLATSPERPQVGIIFDADRLNMQAQNAFLKTLEEPPAGVILILATAYPRNLLPTIRSRCQTISLITNKQTYSSDLAEKLIPSLEKLRNASGSAVALAVSQRLKDVLKSFFAAAEEEAQARDSSAEQFEQDLSKTARKQLEDMREARIKSEYLQKRQELVDMIQTWFQQRYLLAYGVGLDNISNPELFDFASDDINSQVPISQEEADRQQEIVNEFTDALNANVNEELALDAFTLSLCQKL